MTDIVVVDSTYVRGRNTSTFNFFDNDEGVFSTWLRITFLSNEDVAIGMEEMGPTFRTCWVLFAVEVVSGEGDVITKKKGFTQVVAIIVPVEQSRSLGMTSISEVVSKKSQGMVFGISWTAVQTRRFRRTERSSISSK